MIEHYFLFLRNDDKNYHIVSKKNFSPLGKISQINFEASKDFATRMTTEGMGEHRDHRTGGEHRRKPGEIYQNALNGKLSEFALYEYFLLNGIKMDAPDVSAYPVGAWDSFDFQFNSKKLNVKSTKYFGNLLLLETGDWNQSAEYVPNIQTGNHEYDYFILIRLNDNIYDIPGYVTREDLIYIINNGFVLPRGSFLNGKMRMDAENYYIQSGNLRSIENLVKVLNGQASNDN